MLDRSYLNNTPLVNSVRIEIKLTYFLENKFYVKKESFLAK